MNLFDVGIAGLALVVLVSSRQEFSFLTDRQQESRPARAVATLTCLLAGSYLVPPGARPVLMVVACGGYLLAGLWTASDRHGRPRRGRSVSCGWAGSLWLWCTCVDLVRCPDGRPQPVTFLLALLPVLGTYLMIGAGRVRPRCAGAVVLLPVLVSGLLAPCPGQHAWAPCTVGEISKCTAAGALFRGPFPSENYLAILCVIALSFVVSSWEGTPRIHAAALCMVVLWATGSRTCLIAAAAVALWCIVFPALFQVNVSTPARADRSRTPVPFSLLSRWVLVGAVTTFALYSVFHASTTTWSTRGNIWVRAVQTLRNDLMTGLGISSWTRLQEFGILPAHYPHSQYLFLLFSGGFIAVFLHGAWVVCVMGTLVRASPGSGHAALGPALTVSIVGITEIVWNPLAVDGLSWLPCLLMLVGPTPLGGEPSAPSARGHRIEPTVTK